jgi:hypothetical protein
MNIWIKNNKLFLIFMVLTEKEKIIADASKLQSNLWAIDKARASIKSVDFTELLLLAVEEVELIRFDCF